MSKGNFLKIDWNNKSGNAKLTAVNFKDGEYHIIYIPSLNLSSYGETEEEAYLIMKDIVIKDFLENLLEASEHDAKEELRKLGWNQNNLLKKQFTSKAYINKEGILKAFELEADTQIEEATLEL